MTALEALKIGSYSTTGTTLELLKTPMINVDGVVVGPIEITIEELESVITDTIDNTLIVNSKDVINVYEDTDKLVININKEVVNG